MIPYELEQGVLQKFRRRNIMTLPQLQELLGCAAITLRKRLASWNVHTSYNHNGRYYALPGVPTFDADGLWVYRGVRFSRWGTLKQTVMQLVAASEQGLSSAELGERLGLDPRSFMGHVKHQPGMQRVWMNDRYVYFSDDPAVAARQQAQREHALQQQTLLDISDHDALQVLADMIRHPETPLTARVRRLRSKGIAVTARTIEQLLQVHGITEKKLRSSVAKGL